MILYLKQALSRTQYFESNCKRKQNILTQFNTFNLTLYLMFYFEQFLTKHYSCNPKVHKGRELCT